MTMRADPIAQASIRRCFVVPVSYLMLAAAATAQVAQPTPPATTAVPAEQRSSSWASLTPMQRSALAPLQQNWSTLAPAHQSKWLEIAKRYPQLSEQERQLLQRRMSRWASLSVPRSAAVPDCM